MKKTVYFPEISKEGYKKQVGGSDSYMLDQYGLVFSSSIGKIDLLVEAGFVRKLEIEDDSLLLGKKTTKTYEEWKSFLDKKTNKQPIKEEKQEDIVVEKEAIEVEKEQEIIQEAKEEKQEDIVVEKEAIEVATSVKVKPSNKNKK